MIAHGLSGWILSDLTVPIFWLEEESRVKYTRSFFSYIRRNLGINILLFFVIGIILFVFILVSGYKDGIGQQASSVNSLGYEYYIPEKLNLTCNQVEDFYQAVSSTVGGIDRLVVRIENTIELFSYSDENRVCITSFYPFDKSFIPDAISENSLEDENTYLILYNQYEWLIAGFSNALENGKIVINQPSPNEIIISLASDEESAVNFHTVALSYDKISPYKESLFLITSWEQMKSTASPITGVSFVIPDALTDEEVSEVNRLSKYLLGSEFELYSEPIEESHLLEGLMIYVGVGLAVFAVLQVFLYICNMRKREFLVFEFCGETSWGILFHCLYHFAVLLIFTDVIGVGLALFFNAMSRRFDLMIVLSSCSMATNVIVFDLLALIICSLRVFISQVRRKDLHL